MKLVKKIHKWASVLVGIQLFLWLLSGIYFNVMDHTKASGSTYRSQIHENMVIDHTRLVEPKTVLGNFDPSIVIKIINILDQPYYLLSHVKALYPYFVNRYTLVDAYTGQKALVDESFVKQLASKSYKGPGEISSVTLITGFIEDFPKQKNPTWQVNFSDEIYTSVYIEQGSGRIVGHSDDEKRLADFFFMLHFMDYAQEGSFNNWPIIIFAFITLWLCISGLVWTVDLGLRGQYQIKYFAKQRGVKLFDKHQKSMGAVSLSTHTNLLDGLIEHDIALPSTCGGGGTCGRCKVMITPAAQSTSADHVHFSDKELQQGYRLACQHFCNDVDHMTLIDVTEAKKHTLELTQSRFVSPHIKELRFKIIGEASLYFKAGAFMRFFIPAAKGVSIPLRLPEELKPHWQHVEQLTFEHNACSRSYSFAQPSTTTDELVFTVKIQTAPNNTVLPGVGSSYLCNLALGQTVEVIGPFEAFFAKKDSNKTMVMLGAGSGMAPLKAIIEDQMAIMAKNSIAPRKNIHFFYGARTESDLLYADEFYQLAQQNEHFHYYPILSQTNDKWQGATGYVQDILLLNFDNFASDISGTNTTDEPSGELGNVEFYLCGPQGLMDETMELLKAKGVDESAISFDEFS